VAADQMRGRGADAAFVGCMLQCANDARVLRKPEIIVAAEIDQLTASDIDAHAVRAIQRARVAQQTRTFAFGDARRQRLQ